MRHCTTGHAMIIRVTQLSPLSLTSTCPLSIFIVTNRLPINAHIASSHRVTVQATIFTSRKVSLLSLTSTCVQTTFRVTQRFLIIAHHRHAYSQLLAIFPYYRSHQHARKLNSSFRNSARWARSFLHRATLD